MAINSESSNPSQADIEKFKILSEKLGLTAIREDVDQLKQHLTQITTELGNTNTILTQVVNLLNQGQTEQIQQNPPAITTPGIPASFDPAKAQMLTSLTQALSQLVQAWRGASPNQVDPMGELGKQMLTDLVRATVDDIQQRVYGIRKIPPPNVLQTSKQTHTLE